VLDRASTFADPEIVQLLKTRFIAVAIDQAYHRRQQDAEGEFYRKIAGQGPRNDFKKTTQGLYLASASGKLLGFNNNRGGDRIKALMKQALEQFQAPTATPIEAGPVDGRYSALLPGGGMVVRVQAKILGGYEPTTDPWRKIYQDSLSRDNLWLTAAEQQALVAGGLPSSLQQRLVRYHLIDNTRGEPQMWKAEEITSVDLSLEQGRLDQGRSPGVEVSQQLIGNVTQFDDPTSPLLIDRPPDLIDTVGWTACEKKLATPGC